MFRKALELPTANKALPGRAEVLQVSELHAVNQHPVKPPFDDFLEQAMFGLGCFWGAERKFWQLDGVYATSVGYAAGLTENASYEEVCTGLTGHNEVVRVIYDPAIISYDMLLSIFWTSHNPTQGYQQGNDVGTQYRSGIYYYDEKQKSAALNSKDLYQKKLSEQGCDDITTEIITAPEFYFAEDYHQQYLHKNPNGYCGLGGLNIPF